jgi:hypothetical protein
MPRVSFGTFSLEAPDTWTLNSVILAGPVEDTPSMGMLTTKAVQPFQRNLITTLEQVGPQETLESYVKRQVDGLKEAGVPRQEVKKPEKVSLASGEAGLITEQVIQGGDGSRVRQMQLVVFKNGVAHTTIASHLDGPAFEAVRQEFRQMLLSFV